MRLTVAPLRYGAGVKGKVGISLSHGVPVVGTPVALEGMNLIDGEEALSASGAPELASEIVKIYTDEALWRRVSDAGIRRAKAETP